MKAKIFEQALVITSSLKFEDIKNLEKIAPETLALTNNVKDCEGKETTEEIFRITTAKTAQFCDYGIAFVKANKDGYAVCTLTLPNKENLKDYVVDTYVKAFVRLETLEAMVASANEQINKAYEEFKNKIEIIGE